MASPRTSSVAPIVDNAQVVDTSGNKPVQVLGINVAISPGAYRNPSIKLVLAGHTIVKHDFNKNATELDWKFNVPYIFRDGPPLTVQLCEGRMIGKSKPILQWPILFLDAHNTANTSHGNPTEFKLNEDPKIILILASLHKGSDVEVLRAGIEIMGKRKNVLDHLGRSRTSFETLLSLGTVMAELHPISKAVLGSVNIVYNILKEQERCNDLILELAEDMARTLEYMQDVEQFARIGQFVETLKELQLLLSDTQNFIIKHSSQSAAMNAISSASSSRGHQIEELRSRFERFKRQFDRGLAVQTAVSLESLLTSKKEDKALEDLKPRGLGGDSLPSECMDGTRQDILNEIDEWLADFDAPNILWIKGHPGVGKSAIASSVVGRLRGAKRLGSRFFFERAKVEVLTPSALWRMVAFDLSRNYPLLRRHLVTKLDTDRDLPATGNLDELFRQLIQEPLTGGDSIPIGRLPVIVVDALDECGGLDGQQSEQRKRILRTLSKWAFLPRRFKIVVTSRDESDIGRVLQDISRSIEIATGSSVSRQSSTDIGMFLEMRFREIVEGFPALDGWPGTEEIERLVRQAGGLFIWARVVADFIRGGDPREQLSRIQGGEGIAGDMASLYSHILQISFPNPTSTVMINFHSIIGATILAQRPLPTRSLAHLLGIDEISMQYICDKLSSVVEFKSVVRITHQSFTDFMIDQTCPSSFRIDRKAEERKLAQACLRTMKSGLKFNICNLESSYRLNSEVVDLEERIDRYIPTHLQYACCYWSDHLSASEYHDETHDLLENFLNVQFLYWLEALSVTKRMNTAAHMISSLMDYLKKHQKDDSMAIDMQKFIITFAGIISRSAPHIYVSALALSPQSSTISKNYRDEYAGSIKIEKGGLCEWPAIQNIFYGHTDSANTVAFSQDGKRIASGSDDTTIRIWDAETGEAVGGPFEGHTDSVKSVAFSSDGRRVVSGSRDRTIRIWGLETGEVVAGPFKGHIGSVKSVAFSPDGRHIVSGSRDKTIRIWDAETGEAVAGPFEGHTNSVQSVTFSPDGRRVASGSGDRTIRIWDAKTGEAVAEPFEGHTNSVKSVAFSPDGRRIASGSYDGTIRIWDAEIGEVVAGPFEGHTNWVQSVVFSPDGRRIASGSVDYTIRIWDAEKGEAVSGPFNGHTGSVKSVAFSPDGRRVASGSDDRTIRTWDAETGEAVAEPFEGHTYAVLSVAFSPDGRRVASGSGDKTIRIWDAEMGEAVTEPFEGHTNSVQSVTFSPDGRRVASGSRDREIRIWDAETGEVVLGPFEEHTDWVQSVAFSPDGRHVVSGSDDKTIRIWDAEMGKVVAGPFEGHTASVQSVTFSRDGRRVASGSDDRTIRIWDAETGETVAGPFEGHKDSVQSVTFSPDGRRIVSGSYDRTIRIWDAEIGEVVAGPFEGHTNWVQSVVFSPDGRRVASGSVDGTIRIWDAETGEAVAEPFEGHTYAVLSVAFSPDGRRVASGSVDATIRIWDVEYQNPSLPFLVASRMKEGWIVDSHNNRLFWVPPALRPGLLRSHARAIMGNLIVTKLDFNIFKHGQAWTQCRASALSGS